MNSEYDREQRERAIEKTGSSFVVEASAGTGKTRTLIDRILYLALEKGPEGRSLPLSSICAITFTEKAAGEMKIRLRQSFEQILSEGQESAGRLDLARKALHDLEGAAISTIHSFAVSLLKERPVEAGLDPHFKALDDIQSELYFREVWESWIGRALAERNPFLEKALRNGFNLESLENLARILRLNWLTVRDLECDAPPSEEQYLAEIGDFLNQGREFRHRVLDPRDKLAGVLEKALNWLEKPNRDNEALSKAGNVGSGGNWEGGKDSVGAVREFIGEVVEFRESYQILPAQQLLGDIVRWIKEAFVKEEWENRKKCDGLLDFDDQLWRARDLLRNPAVRREFQRQYRTLLVDEFQDTDPVQWEIVLLLSSAVIQENDFARLRPEPGRLFIVGDPKQSIYRFRNADIETYLKIVDPKRRESLGLDLLKLTTNFRSVPSILNFVDAAFEGTMKQAEDGGRYQPDYLAFGGHGNRKAELHPPAVSLLADNNSDSGTKSKVREFIQRESRRIALLIGEIRGSESWKIQDPAKKGEDGWRVPQYGDIAVLLPVLTHTNILEEELRDRGIPYVLEGGKFYYARSEVSSAITILRAVSNPNDSVAVYGSLRSIFFGLSDEGLLRARVQGLSLDYREQVPRESSLHFPFEILRDLHRHRHERRASETLEVLLQRTGAREVLAARGFQSLANLNKLGRTLRALQGEAAFSQVVDLIGMMDEEGLAESESRLMEERGDAVRIMSIHKAKGLEFPIVFVAAFGLKKITRGQSLLADPHGKKIFALNIGPRESGLQTSGWKELADEEKKREQAESVRLLYVALTRASDHLILSTHTAGWVRPDGSERWLPDTEATRLKPLGSFLADCLSGKSGLARLVDVDELDRKAGPSETTPSAAGRDVRCIVEQEYKTLHTLLGNTPSSRSLQAAGQAPDSLDHEDYPPEERIPEAAGNRAVRLGIAFHEAMERADLFCPRGPITGMQDLAARHRLDGESARSLEEMTRITLSSELLEQARAAVRSGRRILRELPFVRPLNQGVIEEGEIDLLIEEENGWVLVDYKTDWVSKETEGRDEFFRDKYAGQIREYVNALQGLSVKVASAYLLLARTGDAVQML